METSNSKKVSLYIYIYKEQYLKINYIIHKIYLFFYYF